MRMRFKQCPKEEKKQTRRGRQSSSLFLLLDGDGRVNVVVDGERWAIVEVWRAACRSGATTQLECVSPKLRDDRLVDHSQSQSQLAQAQVFYLLEVWLVLSLPVSQRTTCTTRQKKTSGELTIYGCFLGFGSTRKLIEVRSDCRMKKQDGIFVLLQVGIQEELTDVLLLERCRIGIPWWWCRAMAPANRRNQTKWAKRSKT